MSDVSRTVWCGNLSDKVTEELLFELFLQVAPLERVRIPQDKEGRRSNFGFVTFKHESSVPYIVQLFSGISMFDKKLNIKPRGTAQNTQQRNEVPNMPIPFNPIFVMNDLLQYGQRIQHNPESMMQLEQQQERWDYRERRRDEYKPYGHRQNSNPNRHHKNNYNTQQGHNYDKNRRYRHY